ncbi:hypothetical protein [Pseudonocardia sp. T1-2H]|uniref:hypothetical protein n=1 Tax=Pseudonocardia sp. T1-2H TaxID=3128899 RepID=UPI003101931E
MAAVTCSRNGVSAATCSTPPPSSMTAWTSSSTTSGVGRSPPAHRALLALDRQVAVRVADHARLHDLLLDE